MRRVNAERNERNADIDQRIDESTGTVRTHVITHDSLSLRAERHQHDSGGNA